VRELPRATRGSVLDRVPEVRPAGGCSSRRGGERSRGAGGRAGGGGDREPGARRSANLGHGCDPRLGSARGAGPRAGSAGATRAALAHPRRSRSFDDARSANRAVGCLLRMREPAGARSPVLPRLRDACRVGPPQAPAPSTWPASSTSGRLHPQLRPQDRVDDGWAWPRTAATCLIRASSRGSSARRSATTASVASGPMASIRFSAIDPTNEARSSRLRR